MLVSMRRVEGVGHARVDAGKLQLSHRSPAFVTSEQKAPCSTSLLTFWGCAVVLHLYELGYEWSSAGAHFLLELLLGTLLLALLA